jgi:predicted dehydrogenase
MITSDRNLLLSRNAKNPLRVAVVGLGKNGLAHIRAFEQLGASEAILVGVMRRNSSKSVDSNQVFEKKLFYKDFDSLHKYAKPHLVIISVPIEETYNVVKLASKYTWDILIEKPLGLNLYEAKKILDICAENTLSKFYLGLNRRFLPTSLSIFELIESQKAAINSRIIVSIKDRQSRFEAEKSGFGADVVKNWHFANSIHNIDLGIFYLGLNKEVELTLKKEYYEPDFMVKVSLESSSRGIINYEGIWANQGYWGVSIHTKDWWIRQVPLESIQSSPELKPQVERLMRKYRETNQIKPGFLNQAKALAGNNDYLASKLVTINEGYFSMYLIDRVFSV